MTHESNDDGTHRTFDRRTLLRTTVAGAGAAAFGIPSLAGVASAESVPDRLYWTACDRVRGDGLGRGEELAVVVADGDELSEKSVRATTETESQPPWGFEYATEADGEAVVAVRTSTGSYVLNPAECAAPFADAVRERYGADNEIPPERENVVEDGDTGDDQFERVTRIEQDDPGWRLTYGRASVITGDQVIVGFEDNTNPNGFRAGAAYVYERRDGEWTEVQKLLADSPRDLRKARFGDSLDADGDRLVVGSGERFDKETADVGAVYVFERTDGEWRQTARLDPDSPMRFAQTSVAVAGDTVLFGAPHDPPNVNSNHPVSVFEYDGESWTEVEPLLPDPLSSDLMFGNSVDFDGGRGVVGAPQLVNSDVPARASVYERDGGEWVRTAQLLQPETASGDFGHTAVLDGDDIFVADEQGDGVVYHYTYDGAEWTLADTLTPNDPDDAHLGSHRGTDLAFDGTTLLVGMEQGVHVFESDGDAWTRTQFLDTRPFTFGLSVDSSVAGVGHELGAFSVYER